MAFVDLSDRGRDDIPNTDNEIKESRTSEESEPYAVIDGHAVIFRVPGLETQLPERTEEYVTVGQYRKAVKRYTTCAGIICSGIIIGILSILFGWVLSPYVFLLGILCAVILIIFIKKSDKELAVIRKFDKKNAQITTIHIIPVKKPKKTGEKQRSH